MRIFSSAENCRRGGAADLPDNLLRRFLRRPGFLSHLRSFNGYDGPEFLPSSTRTFCLTGADAGQALGVPKAKDGARAMASKLFPAVATQWHLKKHDGRAEAALIALCGARWLDKEGVHDLHAMYGEMADHFETKKERAKTARDLARFEELKAFYTADRMANLLRVTVD
jgi:hypothetical protein